MQKTEHKTEAINRIYIKPYILKILNPSYNLYGDFVSTCALVRRMQKTEHETEHKNQSQLVQNVLNRLFLIRNFILKVIIRTKVLQDQILRISQYLHQHLEVRSNSYGHNKKE